MKKNGSVAAPTAKAKAGLKYEEYQYRETRELVQLVKDAADLIQTKGEAALDELSIPGSKWRQGDSYVFVLDPEGKMLVHPDPELAGKNQSDLKDINGKPIIRGLLSAATSFTEKPAGWYHYEWPVPGGLLPRWKSSYVQRVKAPSGKSYIVGSGMYNDRMEREFVVDAVQNAVIEIESRGEAAFPLLYDPAGPYLAKDAYIFVISMQGLELVNPAFPTLVGTDMLDMKDAQGKYVIRDMIQLVQAQGSGWIDYMWPKPGEAVFTQKSAYVSKAKLGGEWVVVGCGVYLADAPKVKPTESSMTAAELVGLVREAAALLEQKGENAFPELRQPGSKWLHDEIYFFVWSMDGIRVLHPEIHPDKPETEGKDVTGAVDAIGKPYGKLFLETASTPEGEGWIHCMWPKPFDIFPTWKSCFVKRVKFPSGKQYLVGSGIYNMQLDKPLIEDTVNRAATLIEERGRKAFPLLRDKKGPFYFMDTYVFVETPEGLELVNPAQPSLEGKNLMELRDLQGRTVIKDEIAAALKDGSAWTECYWYRPGNNMPAPKLTFVRKAQHGQETFIIGSGYYLPEEEVKYGQVRKLSWDSIEQQIMNDKVTRQLVLGEKATLSRFSVKRGANVDRHSHANEEYLIMLSGSLNFLFDGQEISLNAGDMLVIPPTVPHAITVLEDSVFLDFFAPAREDWLRGEDQYLRK